MSENNEKITETVSNSSYDCSCEKCEEIGHEGCGCCQ